MFYHFLGERRLGLDEKPLLVQLNWHKDDRKLGYPCHQFFFSSHDTVSSYTSQFFIGHDLFILYWSKLITLRAGVMYKVYSLQSSELIDFN